MTDGHCMSGDCPAGHRYVNRLDIGMSICSVHIGLSRGHRAALPTRLAESSHMFMPLI